LVDSGVEVEDAGVESKGSETELICSNMAWFQNVWRLYLLETLLLNEWN